MWVGDPRSRIRKRFFLDPDPGFEMHRIRSTGGLSISELSLLTVLQAPAGLPDNNLSCIPDPDPGFEKPDPDPRQL
jgi:hypothetical protein